MPDRLGDNARLQHILDAILEIENYTNGVDVDTFISNSMMFSATLHQLEIIGEASSRLSKQLVQDNSHIPWARMIGLRNLVIHEYFGIDEMTIWSIVKNNIPDLKEKIALIISHL